MLLTQDQEMVRDAVRALRTGDSGPMPRSGTRNTTFPKTCTRAWRAGCLWHLRARKPGRCRSGLRDPGAGAGRNCRRGRRNQHRHQRDQLPGQRHPDEVRQRGAKKQWLAPLAQGKMLGAFCLTEPHVGSDASSLRTTAVKEGDSYVINGVKQFITSGKNGHVAIVIAVTDKGAGKRA